MAQNDAPALALVIGGGVFIYAAISHKRVIDVLLMRPSTLPKPQPSSTSTGSLGGVPGDNVVPMGTGAASSLRNAVCAAADEACSEPVGTYKYDEIRPYPAQLLTGLVPKITDCSGFAILCYKTAGAPDPNGTGYNGQGNTSSLIARGVHTKTPNPADLAFWSAPDHVAVYMGGGEIAEFGGGTGPVRSTLQAENGAHAAFLGYRSYLPA